MGALVIIIIVTFVDGGLKDKRECCHIMVVGGCLKRSLVHEQYILVVDQRNKHCYCCFSRVITEEFDIWIDIGVKVDKSKGKHMDDWWFGGCNGMTLLSVSRG